MKKITPATAFMAVLLLTLFVRQPATAQNCPSINPGPSLVSVNGRQLIVQKRNPDGTLMPAVPYSIKGVCWPPASDSTNTTVKDPDNANIRRPEFLKWYKTDIPLFKKMHVNTIRSFMDFGKGDTTRTILDELYCNDIMVIMTVDDANNNTERIASVVQAYKNHPAILMWMIGNEWNINHYYDTAHITIAGAAQRTQAAALLIKSIDPNHPVSTSYGDIDINAAGKQLEDTKNYVNNICTAVDVWGLNIYRGGSFGTLFSQWKSITGKPMFLSEFGTDAFMSDTPTPFPTGHVDEAVQAGWDIGLWKEIYRHLSAYDPLKVVTGGTIFAWNDEWWKVYPPFSQETGGYTGAHPDFFANEEIFGIVDINRKKRAVYDSMRAGFHPNYNVSAVNVIFKAESAGYSVPGTVNGFAKFYKNGAVFYNGMGNVDLERNRSFNIAIIDTATGELAGPVRNFDAWLTRFNGSELRKMMVYLDSIPNGTLVMMAVRDEAGLTADLSCNKLPYTWVDSAINMLEAMGSNRIKNYCFRDSWTFITIKGTGVARDEQLQTNVAASAQTAVLLKAVAHQPPVPLAPLPELPLCGATLFSANVTLQWSKTDVNYQLQLAADSIFSTVLIDQLTTDTFRILSGLENKKAYYWRLRAINATGPGRWSCTRRFAVRLAPYAEVISAPLITATDTLKVKYEFFNTLNPGNELILQLSDGTGFVEAARFSSTIKAGVLTKLLGSSFSCGSTYRARVISTNPADTSINTNIFGIQNKPAASITPAATTKCAGDSILLTANLIPGASYQWLYNGNPAGVGQTYTAKAAGSYRVRVSKDGCDSLSNPVTLAFTARSPAQVLPPASTTACEPATIVLVANIVAGASYQWLYNNTPITNATGQTYGAALSGAYNLRVSKDGCDSVSNTVTLVFNKPPLKPTITRSADKLSLVSSADAGNQWFKDGKLIPGATGKTYKPLPLGKYTVQVTVNGCISEMSDPISGPTDRVYFFPNPVSSGLTIVNNDADKILVLRLHDAAGRVLKVQQLQNGQHVLNMAIYPRGVYVVYIMNGDKAEAMERIIRR